MTANMPLTLRRVIEINAGRKWPGAEGRVTLVPQEKAEPARLGAALLVGSSRNPMTPSQAGAFQDAISASSSHYGAAD